TGLARLAAVSAGCSDGRAANTPASSSQTGSAKAVSTAACQPDAEGAAAGVAVAPPAVRSAVRTMPLSGGQVAAAGVLPPPLSGARARTRTGAVTSVVADVTSTAAGAPPPPTGAAAGAA